MAPGPFTSMATTCLAVAGLFGAPFVYNQLPASAPPTELAASSVMEPVALSTPEEVPRAKPKDSVVKKPDPPPSKPKPPEPTKPTQKPSQPERSKEQAPPEPVPAVPVASPHDKKQSPQPAGSKQQPDAKTKFEETLKKWTSLAQPFVRELENRVIAFDIWCSGPALRNAISARSAAWGITSLLERWGVTSAASSAVDGIGMSSVAAAAIMSLALVADFGLLALFVLWRLYRCFPSSEKKDGRQKRIESMKKVAGNEVQAGKSTNGAKGKKGEAKNGGPNSGKKAPNSREKAK